MQAPVTIGPPCACPLTFMQIGLLPVTHPVAGMLTGLPRHARPATRAWAMALDPNGYDEAMTMAALRAGGQVTSTMVHSSQCGSDLWDDTGPSALTAVNTFRL